LLNFKKLTIKKILIVTSPNLLCLLVKSYYLPAVRTRALITLPGPKCAYVLAHRVFWQCRWESIHSSHLLLNNNFLLLISAQLLGKTKNCNWLFCGLLLVVSYLYCQIIVFDFFRINFIECRNGLNFLSKHLERYSENNCWFAILLNLFWDS